LDSLQGDQESKIRPLNCEDPLDKTESLFEDAFTYHWSHHLFPLRFGPWFVHRGSEGSFELGNEEPDSFW